MKNGWRGSDVIRHVRTLGAHEKKTTNKQKEGDRFLSHYSALSDAYCSC